MTLPTDPTGGPDIVRAQAKSSAQPQSLAGIRELLSLLRELVDRLEDRIDHLEQPRR